MVPTALTTIPIHPVGVPPSDEAFPSGPIGLLVASLQLDATGAALAPPPVSRSFGPHCTVVMPLPVALRTTVTGVRAESCSGSGFGIWAAAQPDIAKTRATRATTIAGVGRYCLMRLTASSLSGPTADDREGGHVGLDECSAWQDGPVQPPQTDRGSRQPTPSRTNDPRPPRAKRRAIGFARITPIVNIRRPVNRVKRGFRCESVHRRGRYGPTAELLALDVFLTITFARPRATFVPVYHEESQ